MPNVVNNIFLLVYYSLPIKCTNNIIIMTFFFFLLLLLLGLLLLLLLLAEGVLYVSTFLFVYLVYWLFL